MKKLVITLCIISLLGLLADTKDVLLWMDFEGKSRVNRLKPLVLELAHRGHRVTAVVPEFGDKARPCNIESYDAPILKVW